MQRPPAGILEQVAHILMLYKRASNSSRSCLLTSDKVFRVAIAPESDKACSTRFELALQLSCIE